MVPLVQHAPELGRTTITVRCTAAAATAAAPHSILLNLGKPEVLRLLSPMARLSQELCYISLNSERTEIANITVTQSYLDFAI